jgi:hypothetical protein
LVFNELKQYMVTMGSKFGTLKINLIVSLSILWF